MHGFGVFRLYMRELLDKLKISFHIFRVGTFKSALEPFFRNDMSSEAKEANLQWLTQIWQQFCDDIAKQRGLSLRDLTDAVEHLPENLQEAEGNTAQMAINLGLVDGIKTRTEFREHLISLVGRNKKKTGFKRVGFTDYLETRRPAYQAPAYQAPGTKEGRVALIIAQGDIVYGDAEMGQIGSGGLTKLLRKARQEKKVKAVVLRIDSGGGSAFASELIRQEVLQLQKAGKPVVVSMGSMAASGAYWLAADADKIYASSNTITGSIGIFGAFPTLEKSLAEIGVFNDGVGTTKMAGQGSLTRPMSEDFRVAVQLNIERGYQQFIQIVANGRGMEPAEVEKIAQGRVWDGATACNSASWMSWVIWRMRLLQLRNWPGYQLIRPIISGREKSGRTPAPAFGRGHDRWGRDSYFHCFRDAINKESDREPVLFSADRRSPQYVQSLFASFLCSVENRKV